MMFRLRVRIAHQPEKRRALRLGLPGTAPHRSAVLGGDPRGIAPAPQRTWREDP